MKFRGQAVALFLLSAMVSLSSLQNIDTTEPIIRTKPSDLHDYSYLGYNLVLHRMSDSSVRIVVSAPNGTSNSNTAVKNTGLIFTCSLQQNGSCTPLTGTGSGEDRRLYDRDGNAARELKVNQTLGIAMDSRGNHFIACGHRYLNTGSAGTSRSPQGVCYYSTGDLKDFERFSYCDTAENDGSCQIGTSVTFAESGSNVVIGMGAPSLSTWAGRIFRREAGGDLRRTGSSEGTANNAWQGYSLTSGHIMSQTEEVFIVSAPRRNIYRGVVNVFSNDRSLDIFTQPLNGEQLGEYYGYSIVAADLTGDGFDELLVGAPMYSTANDPEVGRVFVYRNSGGSLSFVTHLVGTLEYGRFGHAITNLGDINNDGRADIAISAPFGNSSGSVFIYYGSLSDVITRSPVQVIKGSDLIEGSLITETRGFGSALASSQDVDGNRINDLAIGAYYTQNVFLLRTRSVAQVTLTLQSSPAVVNVQDSANITCMYSGESYPCFNITVCGSYPNINTLGSTINLTFLITVDQQKVSLGLEQRVFFSRGTPDSNSITVFRTFAKNVEQCITETALVKNGITDTFNGFQVEVSVSGPQFTTSSVKGNPPLSNLMDYPIVTTTGRTQVSVETLKECENSECIPDLQLVAINSTFETSTGATTPSLTAGLVSNINFWMNLTNTRDDAFLTQITFILDSSFELVRVEPRSLLISCNREVVGNVTRYNCPIANPLKSNSPRILNMRIRPTSLLRGSEGTVNFQFNATSINNEDSATLANNTIEYTFNVSAQADIFLDQAVASPQQVSYVNNRSSSASITEVTDLGPQVSVSFVVRNQGPSTVPSVLLSIRFPRGTDNPDSHFVYPSHFRVQSDVSVTCQTQHINPRNYQIPSTGGDDTTTTGSTGENRRRRRMLEPDRGRSKRSLEMTVRQDNSGETTMSGGVTVNCRENQTHCVDILCTINQLARGGSTQIDLVSYLDERSFIGSSSSYTFIVYGQATIQNSFIVQPQDHRSDTTETQFRAVTSTSPTSEGERVQAWVIIVTVVLGLLFFVILSVILYFVGFFKRKGKQRKEELNAQMLEEQQGGDTPFDGPVES